eukprot:GEZU01029792.1.p1 GENE.GEZU01029792.1~~GEZU01029792.1.p1  ORF type:complete len:331 (+),score=148.32 GEZU01029792.1:135-1127(+)
MTTSSDPITLTRHIINEHRGNKELQADLTILFTSIQLACKAIASAVRTAGISNLYGFTGETNAQGEQVKKLDIISNENFINALAFTERVSVMASEENDDIIKVSKHLRGKYVVVFDPLDGSSNIDAAVPVGSIFGIYKKVSESEEGSVEDVLQPGNKLIAAGYAMYSSSTIMIMSTGNGVYGFTLDPTIGEFILSHTNIRIPKRGKIYSVNEGNAWTWLEPTKNYINSLKAPDRLYSQRYIGSMVADVHRTLLYGGIFMYPEDKKSPSGKLRLLYECNPMSFLVEQAGGKATTGRQRILDIVPEKVHQRVPIYLGSPEDVDDLLSFYRDQ